MAPTKKLLYLLVFLSACLSESGRCENKLDLRIAAAMSLLDKQCPADGSLKVASKNGEYSISEGANDVSILNVGQDELLPLLERIHKEMNAQSVGPSEDKLACLQPWANLLSDLIFENGPPPILLTVPNETARAWRSPPLFVTSVGNNGDLDQCFAPDDGWRFLPETAKLNITQNSQNEHIPPQNVFSIKTLTPTEICVHLVSRPTVQYSSAAIGGYLEATETINKP